MDIQTEISNGLMTITINRPERKNSFTNAMYTALADAFRDATHSSGVKVVLLKGHEGCFSAGNDLGDFLNTPPTDLDAPVFRFLRMISVFPKPVVAQVQGLAIGIGTTVLLHCDLVYAASTAKFSMPFVKLGLCPEAASSLLLPISAGYQKAAELLLLGDSFTALKAYDTGIVSDVLEPAALDAHVQAQVKKTARPATHKPVDHQAFDEVGQQNCCGRKNGRRRALVHEHDSASPGTRGIQSIWRKACPQFQAVRKLIQ